MPIRLCLERGCRNPASYRGRCRECSPLRERVTHLNKAFYNSKRWQITRRKVLYDTPLCGCGSIATDVHHRVDIAAGGEPWARWNLEALCHECHSRITKGRQVA